MTGQAGSVDRPEPRAHAPACPAGWRAAMYSKYGIFCKVVETGSFTRTAEAAAYSQSAVSQIVKALEDEFGTALVERRKDGIVLSRDGEQYYPYIQAIWNAECLLDEKQTEMRGLKGSTIRIGTFTSVSRNILPHLMKDFKQSYPDISFVLKQGDYTNVADWVKDGSVDFGFVNTDAVSGVETLPLYEARLLAVLPPGHRLARRKVLSLADLAAEPFILVDEGDYSVLLHDFEKYGLEPHIEYTVFDDYTILEMVREGLGISAMYERVLAGFDSGLEIQPIREKPVQRVALAWKNRSTMPLAARKFADYVLMSCRE